MIKLIKLLNEVLVKNKKTGNVYNVVKMNPQTQEKPTPKDIKKANVSTTPQKKSAPIRGTNFDIDVADFIKQHPINKKNYFDSNLDAAKSIEDKLKRKLTPQEKSKITRIIGKYKDIYGNKQSDKFDKKEKRETEKRINNNLLPTSIPVSDTRVDKQYYDGPFQPVVNGGYGYYRLKDKYKNTPVDDKVAKQHWGGLYKK